MKLLKLIIQKEFNYQIESKEHLPFYRDLTFDHFKVVEEDSCILMEVMNNQNLFQGIDVKYNYPLVQGKTKFEDFKQIIT